MERLLESRPMCAVCNKPVDKVVEWEDQMLCRLYFRVKCHGQTEMTYLDEEELCHMPKDFRINFTTAFKPVRALLTNG